MFTFKLPEKYATYSVGNINPVPGALSGVYVIRDRFGGVLYIGQSRTLRGRLSTHMATSLFNKHMSSVDIYVVPDGFERELTETIMINRHKPPYNKAKVFGNHVSDREEITHKIHELEGQRLLLTEERDEMRSELRYISDEFNASDGHYSDDDAHLLGELGEELYNVERLAEVRREIKLITSRITSLYEQAR